MYLKKGLWPYVVGSVIVMGLVYSCAPGRGKSYPLSLILIDNDDKVYLDYRPVSNLDWREYMYSIRDRYGELSDQYLSTWPDTVAWKSVYPEEAFDKSLILYANAPIVGITYRQASEYCVWRTEIVNQKFKLKFQFELPSREVYKKVLESKKFTTESGMPYVRTPPATTFYNFCGRIPEYTNDSTLVLIKSEQIGQCVFSDIGGIEYTLPGFRCMARRMSK